MSKFLIAFIFVLSACEEHADTDEITAPPYDVKPVVEACGGPICVSQAVPLLEFGINEYLPSGEPWPTDGLDIEDHADWCEYYGWDLPTEADLELVETSCMIDEYDGACDPGATEKVIEHIEDSGKDYFYQIDRELHFFTVSERKEFMYYARCVKSNPEFTLE